MSNSEVMPEAESVPTAKDYDEIAGRLRDGRVVPFFGAGASLGCGKLPSGQQLAKRIAEKAEFPDPEQYDNLALVASYLSLHAGDALTLDSLLREVFNVEAETTELHRCIASANRMRLIVTTNYDDLIERALEEQWKAANDIARKPWFVIDRATAGTVWFREPGAPLAEVEAKNLRNEIRDPEPAPGAEQRRRPILFKMHGSLDRQDRDYDWYLITEEHYVDYLGRPDNAQIPPMLLQIMRDNSFLFLGYGLRDWNIRVMMRNVMRTRNFSRKI